MASELKAVASLDNSRFLSGLTGMSSGLGGLLGKLTALTAGFLGVRAIVNGFSEALTKGADLNALSIKTGIAAKDLYILQQAFDQTGSSAENVGPAIQKMQQVLSGVSRTGKRGADILKQLGLDPKELAKLGAQEQFTTIARAIGSISNPAQQTAAAIELFGDSGTQLKEIFANPDAIRSTAAALGQLPDQIAKNAQRFDDLSDRMELLKVRSQGMFIGAMAGLAPALSQLVGVFERIDFSKIGKAMGDAIGIAVELFASGDITEAASLAVSIGFGEAVNYLASTIGSMTWWNGAVLVAMGAFSKLGSMLILIFSEPLSYLEAGIEAVFQGMWAYIAAFQPLLAKVLGIDNFKQQDFSDIVSEKKKNGIFSVKSATQLGDDSMLVMKQGWDLMKSAVGNKKTIIDTSENKASLSALIDKARKASEGRATATAPSPSGPNTGNAVITMPGTAGKALDVASDSYSKIGLYLGGAGGSGIDFSRRTAAATEKSVSLLGTIASKIQSSQSGVAVWG